MKYSLQCRGKHVEDMNKDELLDVLYDDIVLEKKVCRKEMQGRTRRGGRGVYFGYLRS